VPNYTLTVSDIEIQRYLFMAEAAQATEATLWQEAGIVAGAVVADVGCGPAAVSAVMASLVGPSGRVIGIDRDDQALAAARSVVERSGATNVELRSGEAWASGLEPASVDVAVMRHVLAHNAPDEQRIVDHLAGLVRPGGSVYLVDILWAGMRVIGADPELEDLNTAYAELHRRRGNDLEPGIRLGQLLTNAGLNVVTHIGTFDIVALPPAIRPPAWAARDQMLAEGIVSNDDLQRWEAAFERTDALATRPTMFIPRFVGIGRR